MGIRAAGGNQAGERGSGTASGSVVIAVGRGCLSPGDCFPRGLRSAVSGQTQGECSRGQPTGEGFLESEW